MDDLDISKSLNVSPFSSLGHSAQEAAMCWPQLTGSCCQGRPPSHTSSPREFQVHDEEQLFDPKMERFFSFDVILSLGSRHLPSGRRRSKARNELLVSAEEVARRVKTCDFSFRLVRHCEHTCWSLCCFFDRVDGAIRCSMVTWSISLKSEDVHKDRVVSHWQCERHEKP